MIIKESNAITILNDAYENMDAQEYINNNTIQVVHKMANLPTAVTTDIEICAIWTAMVSWSNMDAAIEAAYRLMKMCDWKPTQFIKTGEFYEINNKESFHMTLKGKNFKLVCVMLREFYKRYGSIQQYIQSSQINLYQLLYELAETFAPARLGTPTTNSACKRINLLLRWMVRKDKVDLGIWQTENIKPDSLFAILDSTVERKAKRFWLLTYRKETWNAVTELTYHYRLLNPKDPLKYDLSLNQYNI